MRQSRFYPGRVWLDTDGNRIQAHGGSLHHENGWFYWYGEDKSTTTSTNGVWHNGISCYRSQDLYNWEKLPHLVEADSEDSDSPFFPTNMMDRPHILRNESTGKYILFIKRMVDLETQLTSILSADRFEGPYVFVQRNIQPFQMNAGDFDLFIDEKSGSAHYVFEKVHTELIVADLDETFTDFTGKYTSHFNYKYPPLVREAPAHFERNGRHYLICSGTTGYLPNQSEAAVAESVHGPWSVLGDPHPGDTDHLSYRSQISCIFKHPKAPDLYIAMADRWNPGATAQETRALEKFFLKMFRDGIKPGPENPPPAQAGPGVDTSVADYVWLPIRFDGESPVIDWLDEWRVEDYL